MIEDMKSKLMEMVKKKGRKVSDVEGESLKNVLEDLMGQASSAMADKVKDKMKKVSVMSDSREGLEQGLDKAKDTLEGMPESEDEEEPVEHDSMGIAPHDDAMKIKHLEDQISQLKMKLDNKRMM